MVSAVNTFSDKKKKVAKLLYIFCLFLITSTNHELFFMSVCIIFIKPNELYSITQKYCSYLLRGFFLLILKNILYTFFICEKITSVKAKDLVLRFCVRCYKGNFSNYLMCNF